MATMAKGRADHPWLVARFEEQRPRLRAVAYRVLGSVSEAEDAVQEAWLRFSGTGAGEIDNVGAWLTTVVARIALNMLRSRKTRATHVPEPIVDRAEGVSTEHEALVADAVGLALLVVLETLSAPERMAFVLHDVFDLPFEQIATVIDRSPDAARQLASRARRRVQARSATPDDDLAIQRTVVDAFLAAARTGDVAGLIAVLAPDVVLRSDAGRRVGRDPRRKEGDRTCARLPAARPQHASSADQRSRRAGFDARWSAIFGDGVHGRTEPDRAHRYPGRPCPRPRPRSVVRDPVELTRRSAACSSAPDNSDRARSRR